MGRRERERDKGKGREGAFYLAISRIRHITRKTVGCSFLLREGPFILPGKKKTISYFLL